MLTECAQIALILLTLINALLSDALTLWNALNASIALILFGLADLVLACPGTKDKSAALMKEILFWSPVCTEHVSTDGVCHRAPLWVLTSQSVHMRTHRNILKYVKSEHLMFTKHSYVKQ